MEECKKCDADCCRMGNIQVFHDEFEKLLQFQTTIPHRDTDLIKLIYGPCPFLTENRCSIYQHRSQACRRYPLYINLSKRSASLAINSNCPINSPSSSKESENYAPLESFPHEELRTMLEAALESDARLILAEYFLSPYDSFPRIGPINIIKKTEWISEFVNNKSCPIERYQEFINIYIIQLLRRPSYRAGWETEYSDRVKKWDVILNNVAHQ